MDTCSKRVLSTKRLKLRGWVVWKGSWRGGKLALVKDLVKVFYLTALSYILHHETHMRETVTAKEHNFLGLTFALAASGFRLTARAFETASGDHE